MVSLPDHLSVSQINLYLMCSLKYRFQYIDKLPKPFKSANLAFGSAIHSAISWLHNKKKDGNAVTLARLYRIFEADWYSQTVETEIRFKNGDDAARLIMQGREILSLYFQSPVENVEDTDVAFTVPLVNPENGHALSVPLEGFMDLVEKDDGIVEFKTSAQTISQKDADDHIQLTAYGYAYERLYQRPPKSYKLIDFVKTKSPKMIVLPTTRRREDYTRVYGIASQVLKGIKGGIFFPKAGFLCSDCEYEGPCRGWRED
jgi:putative RecB family exonuclease